MYAVPGPSWLWTGEPGSVASVTLLATSVASVCHGVCHGTMALVRCWSCTTVVGQVLRLRLGFWKGLVSHGPAEPATVSTFLTLRPVPFLLPLSWRGRGLKQKKKTKKPPPQKTHRRIILFSHVLKLVYTSQQKQKRES